MESSSEIVLSAPGYYGPGSITAWYCIVAATAVSWIWNPAHRFQPTSDFMAAILYPLIAMVHFAIQLWNFPSDKTQYLRANLMHIIIGNGAEGPVSEQYDYQYKNQVLFDKPGPDMFDIFPRVVTIDAALRINDNCFWLCLIALGFLLVEQRKNWTEQRLKGFDRVGKCLVAGVLLPIINGIFLLVHGGNHGYVPGYGGILHISTTIARVEFIFWNTARNKIHNTVSTRAHCQPVSADP
ncbi:unnamed protein product [Fusarium fujikuroi]|uniref:Uncharacterized protein n=1 Tax=Fusarium fujikuroi TaxID=5127 RepID=A0A9Q9RWK5_FUSFU|nr:unnamed protein product [Fusarium fujikuroi]VTT78559.1 unnamed protein product [Fusarium fujikuroi]VZI02200.1 unnamed protein product [Fusarium fujikuroi]